MREDERKKEGQVAVDIVFETSQARKLAFMREVRKKEGQTSAIWITERNYVRPFRGCVATVTATALEFQQMRLLFEHQ